MADEEPGRWVEAWLSEPRYGVYLAAVRGDRGLALELYEWNAALSAGYLHDLAHLEVALRNAYDKAIVDGAPRGAQHWTLEPGRYFPKITRRARDGTRYDVNLRPREQIAQAVREAGPGAPPGKVIAELMFGFWRYLSSAAHHDSLWIPYLNKAFVAGASRGHVDQLVRRLHRLRNRVVHHEPLLVRDPTSGVLTLAVDHLRQRHDELLQLVSLISTDLETYIAAASSCPALIGGCPAP